MIMSLIFQHTLKIWFCFSLWFSLSSNQLFQWLYTRLVHWQRHSQFSQQLSSTISSKTHAILNRWKNTKTHPAIRSEVATKQIDAATVPRPRHQLKPAAATDRSADALVSVEPRYRMRTKFRHRHSVIESVPDVLDWRLTCVFDCTRIELEAVVFVMTTCTVAPPMPSGVWPILWSTTFQNNNHRWCMKIKP